MSATETSSITDQMGEKSSKLRKVLGAGNFKAKYQAPAKKEDKTLQQPFPWLLLAAMLGGN